MPFLEAIELLRKISIDLEAFVYGLVEGLDCLLVEVVEVGRCPNILNLLDYQGLQQAQRFVV